MKRIITFLLAISMAFVTCYAAEETDPASSETDSEPENKTAAVTWVKDSRIDASNYDYLGLGTELIETLQKMYADYSISYQVDGNPETESTVKDKLNIMAKYHINAHRKSVMVEIDSVELKAISHTAELSAPAGTKVLLKLTVNLPSWYLVCFSEKEGNTGNGLAKKISTGAEGTFRGTFTISVPDCKPGQYYLNVFAYSEKRAHEFLTSVPLTVEEKLSSDGYNLITLGDWEQIEDSNYLDTMTDVFYRCYPMLDRRFGENAAPKTVYFVADDTYSGVAGTVADTIVLSTDYANRNPRDYGFFVHELTHVVQNYSGNINYGGDAWWVENMANYGRFRYYHWLDADWIEDYRFEPDNPKLADWKYKPYGECYWFFAYMDDKYPTVLCEDGSLKYGLIDSLNLLIKHHEGEMLDDDPYNPETIFNRTVAEISGYKCIDALRKQFASELKQGSWNFVGFGKYVDNIITEDPNQKYTPVYPGIDDSAEDGKVRTAKPLDTPCENICSGASILAASGYVNNNEAPDKLIDGSYKTKWCSTQNTLKNTIYSSEGTKQWIVIDLKEEKRFNTYTVINTKTREPSYGNMTSWEVLISNDASEWTSVDYQSYCDLDKVSFDIGEQKARYIMLRIYNPDDGAQGTIRLYEFMLFYR